MTDREPQTAPGGILQLVCARAGAEEYGIDIMRVKEVVSPVPITRVAGAPAFLEGIIELRGRFVAVMDLRKRLGAPAEPTTARSRYVIVSLDDRPLALVVDGVTEVRRFDRGRLAPLEQAAPGAGRLLAGAIGAGGGVVLVLDVDRLLTAGERAALADAP